MSQSPLRELGFPVVRLPLLSRLIIVAATVLSVTMAIRYAMQIDKRVSLALPIVALMSAVVAVNVRAMRVSITVKPDALVVRNRFRTRTVARQHIAKFVFARPPRRVRGTTIYVHRRDGRVLPLDVITDSYRSSGGAQTLELRRAVLQAWLSRG